MLNYCINWLFFKRTFFASNIKLFQDYHFITENMYFCLNAVCLQLRSHVQTRALVVLFACLIMWECQLHGDKWLILWHPSILGRLDKSRDVFSSLGCLISHWWLCLVLPFAVETKLIAQSFKVFCSFGAVFQKPFSFRIRGVSSSRHLTLPHLNMSIWYDLWVYQVVSYPT